MSDNPIGFELLIANFYRELGARVEHNKNIGGLQIDIYAEQETPDGSLIRTAIECKDYARPLTLEITISACKRLCSLKELKLIDKAVLVAANGFTQDSRTHCVASYVECFVPQDLQKRIADFSGYLQNLVEGFDLPGTYLDVIKHGAFLSLSGSTESGSKIDSVVDFVDEWQDSSGQLLTILGEYGSGKTTTCLHLAQKYATQALRNANHARIPIFIELKRFSQSFNLRTFLDDFLRHQHGINIRSYAYFEKLNREGRFILMFDGFDEIATYADPTLAFRYLDEILSLQQGKAKVLLTCRTSFFKDRADLERLRSGPDLEALLHKHIGYQVILLDGLSNDHLQQYLSVYYGEAWAEFYAALNERPGLRSIAERPILLKMIVSTVHSVRGLSNVNVTQLYEHYTDIWIKRDNWRCHLTPQQRANISQFLAYELNSQNITRIHHRDLQTRLTAYFKAESYEETLEQYSHEIRNCTFLRNDMQGFYSFVHRSFSEFLCAKFMQGSLMQGRMDVLGVPVSLETYCFLGDLLIEGESEQSKFIWDILRQSKDPSRAKTLDPKVIGVVTYLLVRCKADLSGVDLSDSHFPEATDLADAKLMNAICKNLEATSASFTRANMERADVTDSNLRACKFERANLKDANFERSNLSAADLSEAVISGANFTHAKLFDVILTPKDVAAARTKGRLNRLLNEQKRLGSIDDFAYLASKSPNKYARKGLAALLQQLRAWNTADGEDVFVRLIRDVSMQVDAIFDGVEGQYETTIEMIDQRLAKYKQEERDSALINKEEQKKRRARSDHRRLKLKREFVSRHLEVLLHELELPDNRSKANRVTADRRRVRGASFGRATGLTKEQSEWLRRNGALMREK